MAVPYRVRYVFKTTNLGKKDLGEPQFFRKGYSIPRSFVNNKIADFLRGCFKSPVVGSKKF